MALIALVGMVQQRSTLAFAQLGIAITLPVLTFGPVAGILVDRWNKKWVLVLCDLFRALLVLLIPIVMKTTGSLYAVYVIVFFVFLLTLFFNTAKMAVIPNLVGKRKLLAANSVNTMIGRVATLAGTVIGGLIVGWIFWKRLGMEPWEAGFYLDSLSYFVSMVALLVIAIRFRQPPYRFSFDLEYSRETMSLMERTFRRILDDLTEVLRIIRRDRIVFFVLSSVIMISIMGGAIYVLVTVIVQQVMNWGPKGVGFLGGTTATGMIVGSLLLGTLGRRMSKKHVILRGFTVLGVLIVVFSRAQSFVVLAPIAFLAGMLLAPIQISQDTYLHEVVPESVRGRIFSTKEITINAAFVASAVIIGFLAEKRFMEPLGFRDPERGVLMGVGIMIVLLSLFGQFLARDLDDSQRVSR
jgi:MFS family permease